MKYGSEIDEIITRTFSEDIGSGDITTLATVSDEILGEAPFLVKSEGVIAGLDVVERVFNLFDNSLSFEKYVDNGASVSRGDIVAKVEGKASSILITERTALNIIQRMSGIATMASGFRKAVSHTKAEIIDTRKTAPGLRYLDKLAVEQGGCRNHRIGLFDMFLIKDNHIKAAGSIAKAIEACRRYMNMKGENFKIEVETFNLDDVREALDLKADIIMLDNFPVDLMKEAVGMIAGRALVEASGGVNMDSVRSIAETGVDMISVGALTHSVKALDISLKLKLLNS